MLVGQVIAEYGEINATPAHAGTQLQIVDLRQARNGVVEQGVVLVLERQHFCLRCRDLVVEAQVAGVAMEHGQAASIFGGGEYGPRCPEQSIPFAHDG